MPSKLSLLEKLQKRSFFTPDFDEAKYKKEIVVFIYNNLKRKCASHKMLLEGSLYLGRAQTLSTSFVMKDAVDNCIVFQEKNESSASIAGEAYLIQPRHLIVLDEAEQNNVYMKRSLEKILLKEQKESSALGSSRAYLNFKFVHAFMYTGMPASWKEKKLTLRTKRQHIGIGSVIEQRPYYEWDYWEEQWPETYDEWDFFHKGREKPFVCG
jgi:gamma-glutamylcyclotransferase (GGCT)/AIG2-like uncharacterized protein YtfP